MRSCFAICVALALVAGLYPGVYSAEAADESVTLTWGMNEPIDSLNPFIGVNDNAYIFYGLVYDYLIAVDENMTPTPNLALSWNIVPEVLPYGSCWQYNLTQNALWHDNEPFSAEDVVFTVDYQIAENYDSMWAYQPYTILIKSAEMIDEFTVKIYFKNINGEDAPCPYGDKLMMPIVPKHIWSGQQGFTYENYLPIGTGPFMCTQYTKDEFIEGSALVLLKNPKYHGIADFGKEVQFDRLILKFFLEPTAMLTYMETGKIDMGMFDAPQFGNLLKYIENHPDVPIGTSSGLSCTGYSIDIEVNMDTGGGNGTNVLRLDLPVRQAMSYATDKEFIRDDIYMGYAEIGSTIISPVYGEKLFYSPNETEKREYDLAKANQTLDDAGYVWNAGMTKRFAGPDNIYAPNAELKFNLLVEEEMQSDQDTATFLKEEWAKVGIGIEIQIVNTIQWNVLVYSYVYDLTISYWSGDPDPNYLLFTQTSYAIGGWSENAYNNPEYDDTYIQCVNNVELGNRTPYILECQRMMYRDCAFMVTVYPYGCYAYRTDTFDGWGDMQANPGRSLSNFWTANPLYFELTPLEHKSGSLTNVYVILIVAVAVVVSVAVVLRLRGRKPKKEEEDVRLP